jgi:hypothetical protein
VVSGLEISQAAEKDGEQQNHKKIANVKYYTPSEIFSLDN